MWFGETLLSDSFCLVKLCCVSMSRCYNQDCYCTSCLLCISFRLYHDIL